jgi:YD repeat-containing protein
MQRLSLYCSAREDYTLDPRGSAWDGAGKLSSVLSTDGKAVTYTYGADGLRNSRVTPGGTTNYLWAGNNVLAEYDSSGDATVVHGVQPQGFAPPSGRYDVTADASSHFVLNPAGSVVQSFSDSNPAEQKLAYTGFGELAAVRKIQKENSKGKIQKCQEPFFPQPSSPLTSRRPSLAFRSCSAVQSAAPWLVRCAAVRLS